ncbi:hypothetical protein MCBMB27_00245 [Methylobacterium phyllosphaerae]|uniref:Uncharacterized protein n=1 Tax=Methylobacterium phyllosphaerae TaxID=418223 RepID=A0AAE8HR23_9HYPH|nr:MULTISPECIES: hypothetical protein [Methylobacterium]APT29536.1 hypothetical protein MCBMB27_00245 [Methylobacterium phyllosphaerae]MBP32923.1 hypothetical protein [Methylobacterium sp.]MDH3029298.1 hypothetical protein [Methylobacterium fujisawaense]SFG80115.1 hypothetical protein SAMN05192567_10889 [Methylobacterium phyllosphaerae]
MPRPRRVVLALFTIGALAWLAQGRRTGRPAPVRITAQAGWTPVTLAPFRGARLLRVTGETAFSLRIDGERIVRVAPDRGATVRMKALRSLDVRAAQGRTVVTLTPRPE